MSWFYKAAALKEETSITIDQIDFSCRESMLYVSLSSIRKWKGKSKAESLTMGEEIMTSTTGGFALVFMYP
jgi:hypothetical protein